MTEKEKMLKGEMYNAFVDELNNERITCKELCHQYNLLSPEKKEDKIKLIKQIFKKCGERFNIEPSFYCDYGYNITIGEDFYSNHNLVVLDCAEVTFGNNVFIGPNCGFYTAQHPLDFKTRNKGLEYAQPIKIGNNVWFGGNVSVLSGVTIGDNAVIGAGSVVVKDIPANCVAVGNPARVIKEIKN